MSKRFEPHEAVPADRKPGSGGSSADSGQADGRSPVGRTERSLASYDETNPTDPVASRCLPEAVPTVAAQWAPDPWDPARSRYWDGAGWSGYTAPAASVTDKPRVAPRRLRAMGALTIIGSALLASEFTWMPAVWGNGVQVLVWLALVFLALLATWVFVTGAVGRSGDGHEAMVMALALSWMGALAPLLAFLVVLGGSDLT